MDTQISEVLIRTDLSSSEKVKLQHQVLQCFTLFYKEKVTEKQVVVCEKNNSPEIEILWGVTNRA